MKIKRSVVCGSGLTRVKFLFAALPCVFLVLAGCQNKDALKQAEEYVQRYEVGYRQAVNIYKSLIAKGDDSGVFRLKLGLLYFGHGEYEPAKEEFMKVEGLDAKKLLAICYYNLGDFREAFGVLDEQKALDEEGLYYLGLTCEKLNLFDKALESYEKIKSGKFLDPATLRASTIEKKINPVNIKDISPQVYEILKNAPPAEDYPQAGAQILFCDENMEITPDNKEVSSLHYVVRILNERGKEGFSETHIDYDSTYEKVELEYARTIKPDGTVVDVGSRHIRDVTKYLNFPLYSNARVYIISFPEIAEGASIEYKLKIYRNQLINKKDFVLGYPVRSSEPIINANFRIELPESKELFIKVRNEIYNDFKAELKPSVEQKDGRLIYSWQFKDIPQIIPESNMPPMSEINPSIFVSTFKNWDEVYSWWWGLVKDKISADDAIKTKVKELTDGLDSDEAKIRKIHNFCAREIRYVAVEYGQAGYEPHKAADIFKNKYGDCKDQAVLLVTMLKDAGFSAYPVLIGTKDYYNLAEDFPTMLFNHAIAAVMLKDQAVFLDPTAETCSFGDLPSADQARKVLLCKEDGYKIMDTPLYPSQHNLSRQLVEIKINRDESINVKKSVSNYGVYDQAQRYWLLYTVPDVILEQIESKIQDVSIGARLLDYRFDNLDNLDKPVELEYSFSGPEYLTAGGQLRIMPQLASLDTSVVSKDKRRYPIDFEILDTKQVELNLELPENFVIKYMPEDLKRDSPWLGVNVEYRHNGNKITFKQKVELKQNSIPLDQYQDFKHFLETLAKKIKQRIVLEEKK